MSRDWATHRITLVWVESLCPCQVQETTSVLAVRQLENTQVSLGVSTPRRAQRTAHHDTTTGVIRSLADSEDLLRTVLDMYNKVLAREDDCLLGRNSAPGTGTIEGVSGKTYKITTTVL
jgi:hypothetical protein